VQVVVVSSTPERVNAAVESIGSAAQGHVVDATKEDQVDGVSTRSVNDFEVYSEVNHAVMTP